ncbi:hypothetical protein BJF93_05485 [Xaviernesmea oryzae]|uniref:Uncharacterized protein n=1 Tax=Xaviernesmea oryzae TaxID=464029 RepID=A0A1Q9ARU3_9HYPH|nr:hypothetical protein [Xaviernesmea oryzae]OLP58086.1 hypothetical protein BJF93_05485 [Xaviernesmea oryzae]SEL83245.1 hypothetical protein SAMN04487976_113108 [Xaviernesmea oryzae]
MEHIAAIMILVGCSSGNTQCAEIEPPVFAFEAMEECQRDLRPAIGTVRRDYGVIYGKCAEIDPAREDDYTEVTWRITAGDELDVTLITNPVKQARDKVMVAQVQ